MLWILSTKYTSMIWNTDRWVLYSCWIQTWSCTVWQDCVASVLLRKLTLFATQERIPRSVPKQRMGQRLGFFSWHYDLCKHKCMVFTVHSLWNYVFGKPIWQEQFGPISILRSFSKNENDGLSYIPLNVKYGLMPGIDLVCFLLMFWGAVHCFNHCQF